MNATFIKYSTATLASIALSAVSLNAMAIIALSNAQGTVLSALTVTEAQVLEFGEIVSDAFGGDVTLDAADGRTTAGPVLVNNLIVAKSGNFTVAGSAGYNYTYSVAAQTFNIKNTLTADTMSVTVPLASGSGAVGDAGFKVGGTLTVGANQPAGLYNTASAGTSYSVVINYQ